MGHGTLCAIARAIMDRRYALQCVFFPFILLLKLSFFRFTRNTKELKRGNKKIIVLEKLGSWEHHTSNLINLPFDYYRASFLIED